MSSADQTMYLPTTDTAAAASAVETGDRSNDGRSSMAICNSNVDCRGCRQPIHDQYVLHVDPDSDWHVHCLRCVECRQLLNENCTCFLRDGLPYCKSDYTRLFSVKCSRCGMGFDRNQLVMRAPRERVYHVDCFRCIVCQTRLVSGSEFALRPTDSEIVCRSDYDTIMMCEVASVDDVMMTSSSTEGDDLLSPADDSAVILSTERIGMTLFGNNNNNIKHEIDAKNNTGGGHADSPSVNGNNSNSSSASSGKKNHQNAVAETTTSSRHASSGTRGSRSHEGHHRSNQSSLTSSSSSKTTRIRTVLNEKQLHTLRTCYAANPRPDALMKDQLVEMTGLSSRVIRVWFQNKRCKDKKRTILIKQLQQQHQDKVHGVPMIASSPVRMQDHQAASGPAASLMHAAAVPVQIHHQYIVPQAPPPQLCPPSVAATGGAQQQQQQHSGPIATWSTPCPSHVVMQQPTTVADLQLLSAAANPGIRCSPSLSISPTSLQLSEPASDDCCPTDRNSSAAFQQLLSTFGEGSVVVSNSGGSVRAAIGAPLDHRTAMVDAGCCFDDVIDDGDNAADFENSLMDDDDQTTVPTSPSVQSDGLGSRVDETGGHVLMTSDCAPGNSILSESCNSVQQTARGRMQQQQHAASLSFMARRHCGRGSHQQQQQQRMDHVMTAVSAADGGPVPATSLHRHHHHHHLGMVTPSTSAVTGGLMGSVSHLVCTDTRC